MALSALYGVLLRKVKMKILSLLLLVFLLVGCNDDEGSPITPGISVSDTAHPGDDGGMGKINIPEPLTLMLFGSGLAGAVWVNRKRSNADDRRR